jgi:hypothetical protein
MGGMSATPHTCAVKAETRHETREVALYGPARGKSGVDDVREELRRFDELVNRCRREELTVEGFEFYSTLLET